jgi:hypothetical protein
MMNKAAATSAAAARMWFHAIRLLTSLVHSISPSALVGLPVRQIAVSWHVE